SRGTRAAARGVASGACAAGTVSKTWRRRSRLQLRTAPRGCGLLSSSLDQRRRQIDLLQTLVRDLQRLDGYRVLPGVELRPSPLGGETAEETPRNRRRTARREQNDRAVATCAERVGEALLVPPPQAGLAHHAALQRDARPSVPQRQLMRITVRAAFRIRGDLEIRTQAARFLERAVRH